jgi:hypothetical protein
MNKFNELFESMMDSERISEQKRVQGKEKGSVMLSFRVKYLHNHLVKMVLTVQMFIMISPFLSQRETSL